jgi:hypothetical protein
MMGARKHVFYSSALLVLLSGTALIEPAIRQKLSEPTMLQLRSQVNLITGDYNTALAQAQRVRASQPVQPLDLKLCDTQATKRTLRKTS